jgi:hypothetical protein
VDAVIALSCGPFPSRENIRAPVLGQKHADTKENTEEGMDLEGAQRGSLEKIAIIPASFQAMAAK